MVSKLIEYVVIYIDDARASGSIVRDEWERDDNSLAPHKVVEEEVFDDIVQNLFRDDHKGMDDNDMEQVHLYNASSTSVFEGCTFSILRYLNCSIYKQANVNRGGGSR